MDASRLKLTAKYRFQTRWKRSYKQLAVKNMKDKAVNRYKTRYTERKYDLGHVLKSFIRLNTVTRHNNREIQAIKPEEN